MKAIVKNTGGVFLKVEGVYLEDGYDYSLDEVELVSEKTDNFSIDWEQRRFELVKAALTGLCANPNIDFRKTTFNMYARDAVCHADAVLAEYRKENK